MKETSSSDGDVPSVPGATPPTRASGTGSDSFRPRASYPGSTRTLGELRPQATPRAGERDGPSRTREHSCTAQDEGHSDPDPAASRSDIADAGVSDTSQTPASSLPHPSSGQGD